MKTRTKRTNAGEAKSSRTKTEYKVTKQIALPPSVAPAPNVFVLPKNLSSNARVISGKAFLQDRTTESRRYLICPERGFFEFTTITTPKHACRSWLLSPRLACVTSSNAGQGLGDDEAYVLQSPDLLVATPLDPLFLILSIKDVLWPNAISGKPEYLTIDSRLGLLKSQHEDIDTVLRDDQQGRLEGVFADRIKAVCDVIEIPGDETESMYCLSLTKLYIELVRIAKRVVAAGLPKSMDERFVRQQLIVPELGIRKEDGAVSLADQPSISATEPPQSNSEDINAPIDIAPADEKSKPESVALDESKSQDLEASTEITSLLRIRIVIDYMMASYMPVNLRKALQENVNKTGQEGSCVDFKPLNDFLAYTGELRTKANVLRSLSENITRKRSAFDDDESFEKLESKKRKKEQEELKKRNITRGVQQLAKADTSGMKKLSAFFTKPAAKKV